MLENLKAFYKANNFIITSFQEYKKFSTKSEKIFDILLCCLLALGLTIIPYFFFNPLIDQFIINFKNVNTIIITSISILAGFNVASIAVIATSDSDVIKDLKATTSKTDKTKNKFSIIVIFFTWAIVIQLIVVLTGIIFYFICNFFVNDEFLLVPTPIWIWILFFLWLSIVLHAIFISIRNIKMFYLLIINGK